MIAPPPATSAPSPAEEGRFEAPQAPHPSQAASPISDEERAVIQECQSESFWYRSLPISGVLAASAHLAVQRGVLRPSASYGSGPKVILASIVGYFAGKFSYATTCADKLLYQAPDSDLAEAIRARRGLPLRFPERAEQRRQHEQQMLQQWQQGGGGNNGGPAVRRRMRDQQLQMEQQQEPGFSTADPGGNARDPEPRPELSGYDELRRQNRGGLPPPPAPPAPPAPQAGTYPPLPPAPAPRPRGTNKYGDEGFE